MNTWRGVFYYSLALTAVLSVFGCGDGRRERVPVAGQVLIDGKPLTQGQILFVPPEGRASQGKLDSEGRFRLTCFDENDGAVRGTHRIAITSAEPISPTKTRWFAPKKLADPRTSGLSQEIREAVNNLVLEISWEGGHEYVEITEGSDEGVPKAKTVRSTASD